MLGHINTVTFDIFDPAFRNGSVGVVLGFRVGNFLDFFDAIDFETKVMDSPRIFFAMDESEIEMAVGEINSSPGPPMFLFHAEDAFVILCGLVEIFDVDRNMPDSWFFHVLPPFRFLILAFTDFLSILHPLPSILSCKISSMVSSPSPAPRPHDTEQKDRGTLLRH